MCALSLVPLAAQASTERFGEINSKGRPNMGVLRNQFPYFPGSLTFSILSNSTFSSLPFTFSTLRM
jgi:hypothetical protein